MREKRSCVDTERRIEWVDDAAAPDPEVELPDLDASSRLPIAPRRDREPVMADAAAVAALRREGLANAAAWLASRSSSTPPDATPDAFFDLPLESVRFAVVDLETTGGRAGEDDILEIGIAHLQAGALGIEFTSFVKPEQPITPGSLAVHGITESMVADAPRLESLLPTVLELVRDAVLVFHNAPFDLGFLQRALTEDAREPLVSPVLDTVALSRRLLGGRCGLGHVGARLGIASPHRHRALPDARLTALVLAELLAVLQEAGARTVGDVPGVARRPPRLRRRRAPRRAAWGHWIESACASGRALEVHVRLRKNAEAYVLHVVPVRWRGATLVDVRDLATDRIVVLDLAQVDRLAPVPSSRLVRSRPIQV